MIFICTLIFFFCSAVCLGHSQFRETLILFHRCKVLHCINIPWLIQLLMYRHLGYFQYFAITNNSAINICICMFILLEFCLQGKFLEVELLDQKIVLNRCEIIRYCQNPLQGWCTSFHSHQQSMRISISHNFFNRMCCHAF